MATCLRRFWETIKALCSCCEQGTPVVSTLPDENQALDTDQTQSTRPLFLKESATADGQVDTTVPLSHEVHASVMKRTQSAKPSLAGGLTQTVPLPREDQTPVSKQVYPLPKEETADKPSPTTASPYEEHTSVLEQTQSACSSLTGEPTTLDGLASMASLPHVGHAPPASDQSHRQSARASQTEGATADDGRVPMVELYKEALLWTQLNHINLLPFLGINISLFPEQLCLVSPWMSNGHVMAFLRDNPDHDKLTVLTEIAAGMAYLHFLNIVHGDIKGENILVSEDRRCKLADFGLAMTAEATTTVGDSTAGSAKGSLRWMAPELFKLPDSVDAAQISPAQTSGPIKLARDIWAYGCTVLEIMSGEPPFTGLSDVMVMMEVVVYGKTPEIPPTAIDRCSDEVWKLTQRCWTREIKLRPLAPEICTSLERINPPLRNADHHVSMELSELSMSDDPIDDLGPFFVERDGRIFSSHPTASYPFPSDLPEHEVRGIQNFE
ncbi:Homeobox protein tos8 [Marasmius crinis-equi]|uniref:Homeobox protein tos8 n=1 Tax=Marasmius crinis-equi TaxID=585013 RepID=A0ABR3EKN4_9AGAR